MAFAQTYFALQTRRQELIEQRLADMERLTARRKLSQSEKILSGLIYEHVEDERGFSRIRIKGDQALFGGVTTRQMKRRLRVPKGRALADFLPTITIKAKDFANEITNFSIKRDYLHTEAQITREHIKNNRDVRKLLGRRQIVPEKLPAAEDVKKVERRVASEASGCPNKPARLATQLDAVRTLTGRAIRACWHCRVISRTDCPADPAPTGRQNGGETALPAADVVKNQHSARSRFPATHVRAASAPPLAW